MKVFAKWSLVAVVGILLTIVSGCQEEKVVPSATEAVEEVAPAVEHPVVEDAAVDVPMDHPAH